MHLCKQLSGGHPKAVPHMPQTNARTGLRIHVAGVLLHACLKLLKSVEQTNAWNPMLNRLGRRVCTSCLCVGVYLSKDRVYSVCSWDISNVCIPGPSHCQLVESSTGCHGRTSSCLTDRRFWMLYGNTFALGWISNWGYWLQPACESPTARIVLKPRFFTLSFKATLIYFNFSYSTFWLNKNPFSTKRFKKIQLKQKDWKFEIELW